tara:strand:- start:11027 stop:12361 length:1335 start_codon:yes stop_codon:yes gene_type:complete
MKKRKKNPIKKYSSYQLLNSKLIKNIIFASLFFNFILGQNSTSIKTNFTANQNIHPFINNNSSGLYSNEVKNNFLIKSKLKKERFEYQIMLSIFEKDISFLDSYFTYTFKKMDLGLGNFKTNVKNRNLELSSGSMILSNNANGIPSFYVDSRWLKIKNFKLRAQLVHGEFPKQNRFKAGPLLHYKSLHFQTKINTNKIIQFGIEHAVQWGGVDINGNKLPERATDYKDVFLGQRGGSTSPFLDQVNRIGNGLGAFNILYSSDNDGKIFQFYYDHYFDDESGVKFKNFGDGLIGLSYKTNTFNFLFEHINTTHQSGNQHPPGVDSYYFHEVYLFGWSNGGVSMGNIFITPENNRRKINNFGLKSHFKNLDIFLRYAKADNYVPYNEKNNNLPIENHNSLISSNNYINFGLNYKIRNESLIIHANYYMQTGYIDSNNAIIGITYNI